MNKYSYYYFQNALSPENCQKIINLGLSKIEERKQLGYSTEGVTSGNKQKSAVLKNNSDVIPLNDKTQEEILKENKISYVRDSEVSWLNDQWIYDLVYPFIIKGNEEAGWKFQFNVSEPFQFTVYKPGGFYGWHTDGNGDHFAKYKRYIPGITEEIWYPEKKLPPYYTMDEKMVGKVRKISLTINLNFPGEYEGGNLKFDFGPHTDKERYKECTEMRPQGSIILFPSYVHHQVTPVTKGTRYSLVLWTLGDPFK